MVVSEWRFWSMIWAWIWRSSIGEVQDFSRNRILSVRAVNSGTGPMDAWMFPKLTIRWFVLWHCVKHWTKNEAEKNWKSAHLWNRTRSVPKENDLDLCLTFNNLWFTIFPFLSLVLTSSTLNQSLVSKPSQDNENRWTYRGNFVWEEHCLESIQVPWHSSCRCRCCCSRMLYFLFHSFFSCVLQLDKSENNQNVNCGITSIRELKMWGEINF